MEKLGRVLRWVDTFTKWQGYLLAPLCLSLIALTLWHIIGRQLGVFTAWAFDLEWYTNGYLLMLCMGYALLKGQHVRIDIVTTRYPPRIQALLMVVSYLVFVITPMVLVARYAWDWAMFSRSVGEITVTGWAGPMWLIKVSVFAGICLMLPQCFAELIRHTIFVFKKEKL